MQPVTGYFSKGPQIWKYGVAIGAVSLVLVLTVHAQPLIQGNVLLLCLAAVTVSAWFGGLGPGLLATLLAILATDYLLVPVDQAQADLVSLLTERLRPGLFASVAILISALSQSKKFAEADLDRTLLTLERRVHERTEELSAANLALHTQIAESKRGEEERKRLEAELRQAQKLEAIGRLAGGVAHDFNNILMVIQGYGDMLLSRTDKDHSSYDDLVEIRKAAERGSGLTRQLLAFGRKQILRMTPLDLNAVVSDTMQMLVRLIGDNIRLDLRLTGTPCAIEADRVQLEQVLVNLAVNARDAMSQGGTLVIDVSNIEVVGSEHSVSPGRYVRLVLRDNGCGMDEVTKSRLFEPFFTTKAFGKGNGLGLATVYGIVKQLGGGIDVESAPLQGTTFTVFLPRTNKALPVVQEPLMAESMAVGHETVLLVEDDEPVRALSRTVLQRHGYRILEATGPKEALSLAARHRGEIDLVLTDVIMPDMTGPEMATLLRSIAPEPGVLYISGHAADSLVCDGVLSTQVDVVQKPVDARDLLRAVRLALDSHAASQEQLMMVSATN